MKRIFKIIRTEITVSETFVEAESEDQALEIAQADHVSFGKEEFQDSNDEVIPMRDRPIGRIIHTETGYINGDGTVVEC